MKRIVVFLYLSFAFFFLLFVHFYYLEGIPHIPDSAAYLMMAKIFASGNVVSQIPFSPEHFDFFPGILDVGRGVWLFQYPFGHPLLLSIGQVFGIVNVIPPLLAVVTIFLLYNIARLLYRDETWVFVIVLPMLSPFFIFQSVSFMSHVGALFYLTLSLYLLLFFLKKRSQSTILLYLSGLSLGLMVNTRPLSALPFLLIFGIVILLRAKKRFSSLFFFGFGIFQMGLLYILYNVVVSGSLTNIHYFSSNSHFFFSHLSYRVLGDAFANTATLFRNLTPMLVNLPFVVTYAFLLVPFVLRKCIFWDKVFLLCLFVLPLAYFFYDGTFIAYGPRFWYEMIPFFFLLTGRGIYLLFMRKRLIVSVLLVLLCCVSVARLFGYFPHNVELDKLSPTKFDDLKTFNYVDGRILEAIETRGISNAIVFVDQCVYGHWWCYGSVFSQNSPDLDTDVVYAKDLGEEKNNDLIKMLPNRDIYYIEYDNLEFYSY